MKKFLLLIITFACFHAWQAAAQDKQAVDSLVKALYDFESLKRSSGRPTGLADSTKANILYRLSFEYRSSDLDTSIYYARQVLALSKAIGYLAGAGNAHNGIGVVYWYRGEYQKALENNQVALNIRLQTGDKNAIAGSYNNVGLVYDDQGNFPEALKNYFLSLKLYEEIGNKEGIAQAYNNISVVYMNHQNYNEALKNANGALKIRQESNDKWGLTESYSNIGLINFELGNYDEAIKNYDEALKLRKEINDVEGIAISYNNFGDVYKKEGDYAKALQSYQQALAIDSQMGLKKSMSDVNLSIGKLYEEQGNFELAVKHVLTALALATEVGTADYMMNDYERLSQVYAKMNNYKEAYHYKVLHEAMSDSLFNTDKNRIITQLQLQYDYEKKHLSDSLRFTQAKELTEVRLQRQRAYTIGGMAGIILTALLLFVVYRNFRKQREANRILKETQQQLIKSEKMAAFGVMASRVAHEIQNPLNFVNNFADLSQEQVKDIINNCKEKETRESANSLLESLQKINHHGKRAGNIVRKLQELSRTGGAQKFFEEE